MKLTILSKVVSRVIFILLTSGILWAIYRIGGLSVAFCVTPTYLHWLTVVVIATLMVSIPPIFIKNVRQGN